MNSLLTELQTRFGHPGFRPGQESLIRAAIEGRDALGVMPTGGGKSLTFQLPAALRPGTAVVVSPLIALMKDQVDALRARGIRAEGYNSTLTAERRRDVRQALARGEIKLLYIAPERMQAEGFLETLAQVPVSMLAIDEAHCISHWGHDFRPDYRRLGALRRMLRGPDGAAVPVIALTATATQRVQDDIVERLEMRDAQRVITGFRRDNLAFEVRRCPGRAEKLAAIRELWAEARESDGSLIVYAATRKSVERVAGELAREGAGFYHAGLPDAERSRAQEAFLRGEKPLLVATNAFGMGIDQPDVRAVVHYDIPGNVESYYQEAGRAGRDGQFSRAVLLFNHADVATQEFLIDKGSEPEPGLEFTDEHREAIAERQESQRALLRQLVRYAYAHGCRQKLILGYFGDAEAETYPGCGHCDGCRPEAAERHAVDEYVALAARQALAAVARLNGRFGQTRIAELLQGSESASFLQSGLQRQSTYGLLKDWSVRAIRDLLERLMEEGHLRMTGLEYPTVGITPTGVQVMKGEIALELRRPWGPSATGSSRYAGSRPGLRAGGGSSASEFGDADPAVLAALKDFRARTAREKGVPAYVVMHDKTLQELAARRPDSLVALEGVHGLGPKKIELYGEAILGVLRTGTLPLAASDSAQA